MELTNDAVDTSAMAPEQRTCWKHLYVRKSGSAAAFLAFCFKYGKFQRYLFKSTKPPIVGWTHLRLATGGAGGVRQLQLRAASRRRAGHHAAGARGPAGGRGLYRQ